jgi:hypothetical protein
MDYLIYLNKIFIKVSNRTTKYFLIELDIKRKEEEKKKNRFIY